MRVLVTGASGFLGQHVVAASAQQGFDVRALHRGAPPPWVPPGVEMVRVDLRSTEGLVAALEDVDVVLHTAAVLRGDRREMWEGTVTATRNLLDAMQQAGVQRIVLVSSFAVYQGRSGREPRILDESWATATTETARDAYCEVKLGQEHLVREVAIAQGWAATLARPGVLFGPDHLWTNRLGYRDGQRIWACVGGRATLPLSFVENCADAVAHLAERTTSGLQTVNVIDDDLPSQAAYRRALMQRLGRPRWLVVVPWPVVHQALRVLDLLHRLSGRRLPVPGSLRLETARARWRPTRFSNLALRSLGWQQRVPLHEALDASAGPVRAAEACKDRSMVRRLTDHLRTLR